MHKRRIFALIAALGTIAMLVFLVSTARNPSEAIWIVLVLLFAFVGGFAARSVFLPNSYYEAQDRKNRIWWSRRPGLAWSVACMGIFVILYLLYLGHH